MKTIILIFLLAAGNALHAQIPVTDVANLVNNELSQVENIAKWVESIAQLKQQITQLDQQISLQTDIRKWAGDPKAAGTKLLIDSLGVADLVRDYGQAKSVLRSVTKSLDSLGNTGSGNYRAIENADIDGNPFNRDELTYRRYSMLDATQANTDQVTTDTKTREQELQQEVADTLESLKSADTDAEAQKLSAKLTALNGQLAQIEAARKREVDAVTLQKIRHQPLRDAHTPGEPRGQLVITVERRGLNFCVGNPDVTAEVVRLETQHQRIGKWPRLAPKIAHVFYAQANLLMDLTLHRRFHALPRVHKTRPHRMDPRRKMRPARQQDLRSTFNSHNDGGRHAWKLRLWFPR